VASTAPGRCLRRLGAELTGALIPRVLDARDLDGLAVLTLAPLPTGAHGTDVAPDRVADIAREIAGVDGIRRQTLRSHPYWLTLRGRLTSEDPRSHRLLATWGRLDAVADVPLTWGCWHGDFAPWNMAQVGGDVTLWDFERFGSGVPVGLDLVHFDLQTRVLEEGAVPHEVVSEREVAAPSVLAAHGLSVAESRLVFTIYLLDVAARWIEDGQDRYGEQGAVLDALVGGSERAARRVVDEVSRANGEWQ
jgi:hypothetical protein